MRVVYNDPKYFHLTTTNILWIQIRFFVVVVVVFFNRKVLILSSFLHKSICCGYSLDAPRRGTSNELDNMFLRRKKEKYSVDSHFYLQLWIYVYQTQLSTSFATDMSPTRLRPSPTPNPEVVGGTPLLIFP